MLPDADVSLMDQQNKIRKTKCFPRDIPDTSCFSNILIGEEHESAGKNPDAAQQVCLVMAFMLLICSRESSQIQYVRSQLFISPRKTAKLCVECLHGLT